jgi:hypothetical protein
MSNNKYGARKTECYSGHLHASAKEADHCNVLLAEKKDGRLIRYEVEPRLILQESFVNWEGKRIRAITYRPDFIVYKNGITEFIDVKGGKATQTRDWSMRWKMLQKKYEGQPGYKFTVV